MVRINAIAAITILGLTAGSAMAVPVSDGTYYFADFSGNTYDPGNTLLYAEGLGSASVSGNAANIVTGAGGTSDVAIVRAYASIAAGTEYVVEYDFKLTNESGNRFTLLNSQSFDAPYQTGIQVEIANNVGTGGYNINVLPDYSDPATFTAFTGYNYGTNYHVTFHFLGDGTVDFYVAGLLLNNFAVQNPSLGSDLFQIGDPFSAAGYGTATVDNISIGNAVPEPASFALLGLGSLALAGRRRQ